MSNCCLGSMTMAAPELTAATACVWARNWVAATRPAVALVIWVRNWRRCMAVECAQQRPGERVFKLRSGLDFRTNILHLGVMLKSNRPLDLRAALLVWVLALFTARAQ